LDVCALSRLDQRLAEVLTLERLDLDSHCSVVEAESKDVAGIHCSTSTEFAVEVGNGIFAFGEVPDQISGVQPKEVSGLAFAAITLVLIGVRHTLL
jgi:hypothetical protein